MTTPRAGGRTEHGPRTGSGSSGNAQGTGGSSSRQSTSHRRRPARTTGTDMRLSPLDANDGEARVLHGLLDLGVGESPAREHSERDLPALELEVEVADATRAS